jgi:hypothetical protein
MERTSKETKPIPRRERAYYQRRNQNRIHSALAAFFAEEAAAGRITKKQLAALLEKNPAQITRWLTEPSNYEVDTVSDLLLAMKAEMEHRVVRFAERGRPNYVHPLVQIIDGAPSPPAPVKVGDNAKLRTSTSTSAAAKQKIDFITAE